ncbi:MAG: FixH family protein [Brevundimonas sp.]|uniref:FixH family protein n=1 Tax=Brevundimonas sp. TaxID=1871086 RepID=UPI002488EEDC|nr:FixH family protein [Brevundimonas sp.]MDI1328111.1 FixH family protein [Brevundimonas sp.]
MTAPTRSPKPPFVVKGWHVAAGVVAFFALVVGVDAGFLVMAYRTHPGQVAPRPYEAGLIYNAELERLRVQEALGWRAGAEARPNGLDVLMRDRDGRPLTGLKVSAALQRPATEQGRAEVVLREEAPGQYGADRVLSGAWDARIEAVDGAGRTFIAERRLTWP